ncbi:Phosphonate-transporting ATPase [Desulfurobacterium thermolithotrophum DSM 11699]|uniref:Phosphonate-transporting ATPase n=1 Tax=Desulfurobacterium thermolithotrophum (strain DSM 11699 / BSA) TaxID=868864 RepID=F0S1L0_DESTD|nr:ABC transporter ATP-binding protein [Desulfurobacterium thermolithotrophum]ADY74013.1 Phosphonate-transporting ATPase [Desulfurobacterium thermolithotrophum DSM 11699]
MLEGVRVENLTIGYGKPLVKGLSFHMAEGEFWVVVGPNGVGKSTLMKTILGIVPPISGKVYIHGVDCTKRCEERKFLSYVPQMENYSHHFPATAFDVVLSGFFPRFGRFQRITDREKEIALCWMKLLGIDKIANKQFNSLSGGQQRKVLIARALVNNPHYIFLDEPTTGVDLKSSKRILKLIDDLHKKNGFGICMVTHDLNFVWDYIEKVILIGYNKYFIGNKEDILNEDLLSEIYEIDVRIAETKYGPIFLVGDKHI